MHEVRLGTLTLGCGPIKIAAPLVGNDRTALRAELDALLDGAADLAEWCTGCLMSFPDTEILPALARELKQSLDSLPLLITFRSLPEGDHLPLDAATYRESQLRPTEERLPDLLDVELFSGLPDPAMHIAALQ